MNVLIACEFSGAIRREYRALGHNAWSCDLLPAEDGDPHHQQGDARIFTSGPMANWQWDLLIANPPCTHLSSSGARWWPAKRASGEQQAAVEFARALGETKWIERTAVENPIGYLSTAWRKPDCTVHPWMFGDFETKATCWWLKGLPPLVPTYKTPAECAEALGLPTDSKPTAKVWRMGPSPDRWKERSRTPAGMARAIAAQWQ